MQLGPGDRIERAERLVHQHDRRIGRQRARHADALALAAGQLVWPATRRTRAPADPPGRAALRCARRSAPAASATAPARARHCARRSCEGTARPPGAHSPSVAAAPWNPTRVYRGLPRARDPSAGSSIRLISFRTVLFPAPLRPTSATVSPGSTRKVTSCNTSRAPRRKWTCSKAITRATLQHAASRLLIRLEEPSHGSEQESGSGQAGPADAGPGRPGPGPSVTASEPRPGRRPAPASAGTRSVERSQVSSSRPARAATAATRASGIPPRLAAASRTGAWTRTKSRKMCRCAVQNAGTATTPRGNPA